MSLSAKIPVVEIKKSVKYIKWIILFSISLIFIGLFAENSYIMSCSAIIMIFGAVILRFMKKYLVCGSMIINESFVKFILAEEEQVFHLKDISDLTIKYEGYKGEANPSLKSIQFRDGTGNFIDFVYDGKKVSYQLLFERENLFRLNRIFKYWKNKNIKLKLIGDWLY